MRSCARYGGQMDGCVAVSVEHRHLLLVWHTQRSAKPTALDFWETRINYLTCFQSPGLGV